MVAGKTAVKSTNQNPCPVKLLLAEPKRGRYELMQRVLRHGARGQKYCRNYSHFADAATGALGAGVPPSSSHCREAAQWRLNPKNKRLQLRPVHQSILRCCLFFSPLVSSSLMPVAISVIYALWEVCVQGKKRLQAFLASLGELSP